MPDELVLKLIVDELEKVRDQGFLLEGKIRLVDGTSELLLPSIFTGYPRTLNQAELLHRQMKIDHAVALDVPADELVNRLKDRWVHLPSGRVYNHVWSPPKVAVSTFASPRRVSDGYLSFARVKTTKRVNRCRNEKTTDRLSFITGSIPMIRTRLLSPNSTSEHAGRRVELFVMVSSRKLGVLRSFQGRESDKLWPEIKKGLDRFLQPSSDQEKAG